MLTIRLSRTGKRNKPNFRLIVVDKQKDPWGTFLENVGYYNPKSKDLQVAADRIKFWMSKGAQPSGTIHNLLISKGILEGKKVRASKLSKKRKARLAKKQETADANKAAEAKPAEAKTEEAKPAETK